MMRPLPVCFALLATAAPALAQAPTYTTPAVFAYMKDLSSGTVLYAKDADTRMPPASMGKMMSVYVAFEMIKRGEAHARSEDHGASRNLEEVAFARLDDVPVGE